MSRIFKRKTIIIENLQYPIDISFWGTRSFNSGTFKFEMRSFQASVSNSLAVVSLDVANEMKDYDILRENYSINIVFLGNNFRVIGHSISCHVTTATPLQK